MALDRLNPHITELINKKGILQYQTIVCYIIFVYTFSYFILAEGPESSWHRIMLSFGLMVITKTTSRYIRYNKYKLKTLCGICLKRKNIDMDELKKMYEGEEIDFVRGIRDLIPFVLIMLSFSVAFPSYYCLVAAGVLFALAYFDKYIIKNYTKPTKNKSMFFGALFLYPL